MIAICPVGPPKLIQPNFAQNRAASPKLGRPSPPWHGSPDP